jgi:hypothetical protein
MHKGRCEGWLLYGWLLLYVDYTFKMPNALSATMTFRIYGFTPAEGSAIVFGYFRFSAAP